MCSVRNEQAVRRWSSSSWSLPWVSLLTRRWRLSCVCFCPYLPLWPTVSLLQLSTCRSLFVCLFVCLKRWYNSNPLCFTFGSCHVFSSFLCWVIFLLWWPNFLSCHHRLGNLLFLSFLEEGGVGPTSQLLVELVGQAAQQLCESGGPFQSPLFRMS